MRVKRDVKLIVVYHTVAKTINPRSLIEAHSHEADTHIPLHVLRSIQECTWRGVHIWSPDTDALVLLMDHDISQGHLRVRTKLKLLTGKGAKYQEIDVCEWVQAIG